MKKVLVIAGGKWQVPIIKKVKEMGYYIAVADPYETSPGFLYAEEKFICDVKEKEEILTFAEKFSPCAVITDQTDVSVPTVAYICEKLRLKGISRESAKLFTNKYHMRKFCGQNCFTIPKYRLCKTADDVTAFSEDCTFPFIIKPVDAQSSRGVYKIQNANEISYYFNKAIMSSDSGELLAEEYIQGQELTVEGFMLNGKHHTLAISKKKRYHDNEMVAYELLYGFNGIGIDFDELSAINDKIIESARLEFGITHVEYMYKNGIFFLIEMAARGGGTEISSHIIPIMSGVDVNELLVKCAVGSNDMVISPIKKKICCVLRFLRFSRGVVTAISGIDEVINNKNVIDLQLDIKLGDTVEDPQDDRSRHGFFIAYAKNTHALEKLTQHIVDTIKVEIAPKQEF